jgi:hypothetical protein
MGLIHSPMAAGIIGMSGKSCFETFTLIQQALDPEDEEQALIANWGEDITKVALAALSEEEVIGNVLGIVSLKEAQQLKLIFDPQDTRRSFWVTRNTEWKVPILPEDFVALNPNEDYAAPSNEKDIPVLAVIPKTMVIEFGSEIIAGKTKFEDVIAILQTSHENAAVIRQAWFFLQENYNCKSIHMDPQFDWSLMDKSFAKTAKDLVQEIIWIKHTMLRSDSKDYAVIEKEASLAIQDAIKIFLDDNPEEAQALTANRSEVTSCILLPSAITPGASVTTPNTKELWESMVRAMKSVSKEDKDEGVIETAFFRLLSMSQTIENKSPNDGQTTDFEVNDVNRLLKAAVLGKLKNINTWNIQQDHFCIAMADKESMPYQNMKPLLNNAAFLVKLKGYDFVCGSLKLTTSSDSISLDSFAPMDEESSTFKDMKHNNDETNMEHQLGHKGEQCTKASMKVWCDWRLTSWYRMLQLLQNINMDILFWSY